jgi:precorrin-4/cobalt-precorrin-4 C11-methyltransferase
MTVYFVGAGPGAADLITVRGRELLGRCGLCLYPGSMTPTDLLASCPPGATLVDASNLPLGEAVARIVAAHRRGVDVVRLCSGDPSLYSTVAEQMRVLDKEDVPHAVVPGVSAFAASAAVLGRELTVPGVGQSLVITRARSRPGSMPPGETLSNFARTGTTLAIYLVINHLEQVVEELVPHYGARAHRPRRAGGRGHAHRDAARRPDPRSRGFPGQLPALRYEWMKSLDSRSSHSGISSRGTAVVHQA